MQLPRLGWTPIHHTVLNSVERWRPSANFWQWLTHFPQFFREVDSKDLEKSRFLKNTDLAAKFGVDTADIFVV